MNQIQIENANTGDPGWELTNPVVMTDRDDNTFRTQAIEGYCSATSVNISSTIKFYVSTTSPSVSMKIYRMGYYGGAGGRYMTDVSLTAKNQAFPTRNEWGLIDCNWEESGSLTIPTNWVSGIYLGKLTEGSTSKESYVIFVVRDDSRSSSILFQSSVTTAQAYNGWGQCCFYPYNDRRNMANRYRANQVSFNRPYFLAHYGESYPYQETAPKAAGAGHLFAHFPWRDTKSADDDWHQDCWVPAWEYNMVRWLEQNGYDVTYCTNIDVHEQPALLLSHKIFLSLGHDEYWSREMRLHVEYARNQGIDLAFFSGNRVYRQVRLGKDGNGNANRIIHHYGDNEAYDPLHTRNYFGNNDSDDDKYPYWNVSSECRSTAWPETLLLGTTWFTDGKAVFHVDLKVKDASHWVYTGITPVVTTDQVLSKMAGYELDVLKTGYPQPPTLQVVAAAVSDSPAAAQLGQTAAQTIVYTADSGATVFVAGFIQWSWGLDDFVIPGPTSTALRTSISNDVIKQMTKNLLSRAETANLGSGRFYTTDGAAGLSPVSNANLGWRSKWQIVPGQFVAGSTTSLFLYDPIKGEAYFFKCNDQGGITQVGSPLTGLRKTWQVYAGHFSSSSYSDLLFHDVTTGELYFYRTAGDGSLTLIGHATQTLAGAYKIIPGKFGSDTYDDLLVYNPLRGEAWFHTCDGAGGVGIASNTYSLQPHADIIKGNFGGYSTRDNILVYDRVNGAGYLYNRDADYNLTAFNTLVKNANDQDVTVYTGWSKTLKIVAGTFSSASQSSGKNDLLFYDQSTGEVHIYSIGTLVLQAVGSNLSTWSRALSIIPGTFSSSNYTSFLVYNRHASNL